MVFPFIQGALIQDLRQLVPIHEQCVFAGKVRVHKSG